MSGQTANPLLRLLQERYGEQWSIRKNSRLWVATAHDYLTQHAPTLVEEDIETFVRQLEEPPPGGGRAHLLSYGQSAEPPNGPLEG